MQDPIAPGWHTTRDGLVKFCRRLVNNDADAEDLAQDTITVALQHGLPQEAQHQRGRLAVIARQRAVTLYRKRTGPQGDRLTVLSLDAAVHDPDDPDLTLLDTLADPLADTAEQALHGVELAALTKTLTLLDPAEARLLLRARVYGMTRTALAAELGVTDTTIGSRLRRAEQHLQHALKELRGPAM